MLPRLQQRAHLRPRPGPLTVIGSTSPSYDLDALYGDYFGLNLADDTADPAPVTYDRGQALAHLMEALDLTAAPQTTPGASGSHRRNGSATVVHVSQKLTDPQWLVPSRPAPAPPSRPPTPLLPTVIVTPPVDEPQSLGEIMAQEVQRQLLLLSHETSAIVHSHGGRLVRHLEISKAVGGALASALGRLDRVARAHQAYRHLAAVLPAVRGVLTAHMTAVIDKSRKLPPPQWLSAVHDIQTARHALGLFVVVAQIPFSLPIALQALQDIEAECGDGPTLRELMLMYRAFKEQAARLPPGGDARLRINLPHKYYMPYATPGQIALGWGQHANALWMRYQSLSAPKPPRSDLPTSGPTTVARSRSNRYSP